VIQPLVPSSVAVVVLIVALVVDTVEVVVVVVVVELLVVLVDESEPEFVAQCSAKTSEHSIVHSGLVFITGKCHRRTKPDTIF
jgi:hypothetical protein